MGDVHDGEVGPVGGRVPHLGDAALGGVVLDVDGREVAARAAAAEPPLGEALELVRALQDDDVDLGRRAARPA